MTTPLTTCSSRRRTSAPAAHGAAMPPWFTSHVAKTQQRTRASSSLAGRTVRRPIFSLIHASCGIWLPPRAGTTSALPMPTSPPPPSMLRLTLTPVARVPSCSAAAPECRPPQQPTRSTSSPLPASPHAPRRTATLGSLATARRQPRAPPTAAWTPAESSMVTLVGGSWTPASALTLKGRQTPGFRSTSSAATRCPRWCCRTAWTTTRRAASAALRFG